MRSESNRPDSYFYGSLMGPSDEEEGKVDKETCRGGVRTLGRRNDGDRKQGRSITNREVGGSRVGVKTQE